MTMFIDRHFVFFSFPVSNLKCNLIFFNFTFVNRKLKNESLTIELVTRSEFFHFLISS